MGRKRGAYGIILTIGSVLNLASRASAAPALSTLFSFSGANGNDPYGTMIADSTGNFYGTTVYGGSQNAGSIYKFNPQTKTLTPLASFTGDNGAYPGSSLMFDSSGNLYGTAYEGGANGDGTIFELPAGSNQITALASFDGTNGENPMGGVIADASGNLYGTTVFGGANNQGAVYKFNPSTRSISPMISFTGASTGPNTGSNPYCTLIADKSGNFYGTTARGGPTNQGTVFEVNPATGVLTTLIKFGTTQPPPHLMPINGSDPSPGLTIDSAGNLYGIAIGGGGYGQGEIYKVAAGTNLFSVLASLGGATGTGNPPAAPLLLDAAGDLFGTTEGQSQTLGNSTVFELAAGASTPAVLASFDTTTNGLNPTAQLLADSSGTLYGTTASGASGHADGTIFQLTGSGFIVPEPSTLMLAGIVTLAIRRRR